MTTNPKVKDALDSILKSFETGNVSEYIAMTMIQTGDKPSNTWSLSNRLIVALRGTCDARGFRQWEQAGRHVKKGSKAIHILAPVLKKVIEPDSDIDPEKDMNIDKERTILIGFRAVPVFRYEDTDGKPLPEYENIQMPPLADVAHRLGVNVQYGFSLGSGSYSPSRKNITLATTEEHVFFHEMAHAAHHIVKGDMTPGQDPTQEIIAELSAAVISRLYGKDYSGNSYRYIQSYSKGNPHAACLRVLKEVEQVLSVIFDTKNSHEAAA